MSKIPEKHQTKINSKPKGRTQKTKEDNRNRKPKNVNSKTKAKEVYTFHTQAAGN